MKLEINREKLSRGIQKSEKISSKNSTLPVLSCILLQSSGKELKIKSTNLDLGLIITIPTKEALEGKILVPASTLNSFIQNLPKNDTTVNLEHKENILFVTSKSTETSINTQPIDDFPSIPEVKSPKEFKISSKDLIKGLNSVWFSTAISSVKPELSSVYVYPSENDLVFVSTDSFRLSEKKIHTKNSSDFEPLLIPYKNVVEIIRIFDGIDEEITIFFEDDQLAIRSEEIYLVSRVVDGSFPDYKQIIPSETKTEVKVLKDDLIQGLKLSNIFSDNFNQVTFSIMPNDNIFEIQSNSQDVGETKNSIKSKAEGDNIKISFNSKYVSDCFNSIKSESILMKFDGVDKPMIIEGIDDASFMYLVMPMNR
jgi:DNA polymerase-3 subunit beta